MPDSPPQKVRLTNGRPCCSLLGPIGKHRSQQVNPSRGKRKKRKRQEKHPSEDPNKDIFIEDDPGFSNAEKPAIQDYLTIGFNSTTRYLETVAQRSAPNIKATQDAKEFGNTEYKASPTSSSNLGSMAVVFVARRDQPPVLYSHLPILVKAASFASPCSPIPRLIALPEGATKRLSAATAIPRVGLLGLMDSAPGADRLIEFARRNVPEVEVPWLEEPSRGMYRSVNIKAMQTGGSLTARTEDSSRMSQEEEHGKMFQSH